MEGRGVHSERRGDETGGAKRACARRPSGTRQGRCRGTCGDGRRSQQCRGRRGEHDVVASRSHGRPGGRRAVGARPAAASANGGQVRDQSVEVGDVVDVRGRGMRHQRHPARIGRDVVFGPRLATIGWVRSSFFPRASRGPARCSRPSSAGRAVPVGAARRGGSKERLVSWLSTRQLGNYPKTGFEESGQRWEEAG